MKIAETHGPGLCFHVGKAVCLFLVLTVFLTRHAGGQSPSSDEIRSAMRKAATFFRTKAAVHGGYVYYYASDFSRRWGEGEATAHQVWVQPPGTPAVGMAYLKAFAATGDSFYLDAARETAEALVFGQLESGGWTHAIDFDPDGPLVARYRHGRGRGKNHSSLDDGVSQAALRLLMHVDRALNFRNEEIHEACAFARASLLAAQFPSGGFPQGWSGPAIPHPPAQAQYPEIDWRTENRIKNYWDMPTLNDGLAGTVAATLVDAWKIYEDDRHRAALARLGDFLLRAQMPEPQPAWAQQYDTQMRPIWARKFEPPAIAGRESQDAIETLLLIHRATGDARYLAPIPRALAYLERSLLPDGRLARYYELRSNRPLYMTRDYVLTYDDSDLPQHYAWKTRNNLPKLAKAFAAAKDGRKTSPSRKPDVERIRAIIAALDREGRWLSTYSGEPLVGQPKFKSGAQFIASAVFSENLIRLSEAIAAASAGASRGAPAFTASGCFCSHFDKRQTR